VAEALLAAGHEVNILDLCWEEQPETAIPVFFLEPAIAPTIFDQLDALVGKDPRFLFFDPDRPDRNYNYNANEVLVRAIREGYRGAYWDILRRVRDK